MNQKNLALAALALALATNASADLFGLGAATEELKGVLAGLSYRNLDDDPTLVGRNTTTEVLARVVAERLAERVTQGAFGDTSHLTGIGVTLQESHVASAGYELEL